MRSMPGCAGVFEQGITSDRACLGFCLSFGSLTRSVLNLGRAFFFHYVAMRTNIEQRSSQLGPNGAYLKLLESQTSVELALKVSVKSQPRKADSHKVCLGQFSCGQFSCGQFSCGQFSCGQFSCGQSRLPITA